MNGQRLRNVVVWLGGSALLAAVAVDVLAMIGRQIRIPLIGSIELVQAAIVFAAAAALVIATLDSAHARVSLLLSRMPARMRFWIDKLHALAAALLFAALLAGSVWIAADLWGAHEESELLRIPYPPLRMAAAAALAVLLILSIRDLRRRGAK